MQRPNGASPALRGVLPGEEGPGLWSESTEWEPRVRKVKSPATAGGLAVRHCTCGHGVCCCVTGVNLPSPLTGNARSVPFSSPTGGLDPPGLMSTGAKQAQAVRAGQQAAGPQGRRETGLKIRERETGMGGRLRGLSASSGGPTSLSASESRPVSSSVNGAVTVPTSQGGPVPSDCCRGMAVLSRCCYSRGRRHLSAPFMMWNRI